METEIMQQCILRFKQWLRLWSSAQSFCLWYYHSISFWTWSMSLLYNGLFWWQMITCWSNTTIQKYLDWRKHTHLRFEAFTVKTMKCPQAIQLREHGVYIQHFTDCLCLRVMMETENFQNNGHDHHYHMASHLSRFKTSQQTYFSII